MTFIYLCVAARRERHRDRQTELGRENVYVYMRVESACVSAHVRRPEEGTECSLMFYPISLRQSFSEPEGLFSLLEDSNLLVFILQEMSL